jgi:hypothetical protein
MGLTNFPNGVFATPNVGVDRSTIFASGNVFFVDGDLGGASASSSGLNPSEAVSIPSDAVGKAARGGVIYVRPKMTAASAQSYYLDNITVPITLPNLSILGCGADQDRPYLGPAIKTTVAGLATPVLTVKASSFVTEGMEWTGTSQSGDVSVIYASNDGTLALTSGLIVRNCTIRNVKGHAVGTGGGIHFETPIFCKVQNVLFKDNLASIVFRSTYAAINSLLIENCTFAGAAAGRDVDIFSNADAGYGLSIDNCRFLDALPNHGVINKYIALSAGIYGMISNCTFGVTSATADAFLAATGTIGNVPTTVLTVNCKIEQTVEGQASVITR